MDQQQQVLKENKKDADQDIVLWLNNNAEVSQSASKILRCSCLPAPCWCINISRLLLTLAPPLLQKQLASIEPAYYLNYGEAIAAGEVEVEEVVEEVVEMVKVVEELREPFSSKFTMDWMTKSSSQKPVPDLSQWIEVHYSGSSAADDGLPYRVSLPQPDFSEGAPGGYYGALSAADGKRPPEKACSLPPQ
jgi:hypothetical protein